VPTQDLDQLQRLRRDFLAASGPPGLFHITRVRFDLKPATKELTKGWQEFLEAEELFELSLVEGRAGLVHHCAFYGAKEKLKDYTGLAAALLPLFPTGTAPMAYRHRDGQIDRNQWTLGLYRFAARTGHRIVLDFRGTGSYAGLNLSRDAVNAPGSYYDDRDRLQQFMQSWRQSLVRQGITLPKYVYAAIVTDLFSASVVAIDHRLAELLHSQQQTTQDDSLPDVFGVSARDAAIGGVKEPIPEPTETEPWPPDDGWNFRPGEFAFAGKTGKLKGKLWKLLKALAEADAPVTPEELFVQVWSEVDPGENAHNNLRNHLTRLREALRLAFGLDHDVDPIPAQDKGELLAWKLDNECLLTRIKRFL
jgi:hypothetical protein